MVEILGLAANIDQPVYGTRSAQHLAAGKRNRASGGAGIGFGLETPGQSWVVHQLHVAGRNVDQRVPIPPTCFDQQHADAQGSSVKSGWLRHTRPIPPR